MSSSKLAPLRTPGPSRYVPRICRPTMRRRAMLSLYNALTAGSGLLGLFELEKALYELRYEMGNRPSWAGIPLQGILDWGVT